MELRNGPHQPSLSQRRTAEFVGSPISGNSTNLSSARSIHYQGSWTYFVNAMATNTSRKWTFPCSTTLSNWMNHPKIFALSPLHLASSSIIAYQWASSNPLILHKKSWKMFSKVSTNVMSTLTMWALSTILGRII